MYALRSHIQPYAWGSRTALTELLGRPSTGGPQAELWIGAHPSLPSEVDLGHGWVSLDDVIRAAPERWLGPRLRARFGDELPFLLKVLAAAAPLSIQAHPSKAQAEEGFAREGRAGQALDAPTRSYRDRNHKPEIICALTDFDALCGFRTVEAIADVLGAIDTVLTRTCQRRLAAQSDGDGVDVVAGMLLRATLVERVEAIQAATSGVLDDDGTTLAASLASRYPGDAGVLVALLLNHVRLAPGEALFLGPGNLHAYLGGAGIEVMASSDNVLRGGLTPKHIDVDELLHVLDARPGVTGRVGVIGADEAVTVWPVPVDDFALRRVRASGPAITLPVDGPALLLCTDEVVIVSGEHGEQTLCRGDAAATPAVGAIDVAGAGTVYVANAG